MPNGVLDISVPGPRAGGPVSNVVIVGDKFTPAMFDYMALFDGAVDRDTIMSAGPVVQCTYCAGQYSFSLVPNRVDVGSNGVNDVLSTEVIKAARTVAAAVDGVRSAVVVSSVGLNHDAGLSVPGLAGGGPGFDFCRGLFQDGILSHLTDASVPSINASALLRWQRGSLSYTVRIEPDAASNGDKVFVAINGHQNIGSGATVAAALLQASAFRTNVGAIHGRIR